MGLHAEPPSELRAHLGALRGLFLGVAGFSCVINLLMLAPSLYMLQVYDRVLASRNETTLWMLTLLLLGLYGVESVLEWIRGKALIRGSAALDVRLGFRVFDAAFARGLGGGGSPTQALADLGNLRQFLTGRGLFAFFDAPWTPVFLAVIFLLHPLLGLFSLAAAVALFLLAYANEKATGALLTTANQEGQRASQYAGGQLRNAEAIQAMGMLPAMRHRWMQRQARMLSLQAQASNRAATLAAVTRFVRLATQSGILALGAMLVIDARLSPGAMIAASLLLVRALAPVDQAMGVWRNFVSARGAYARLAALLQAHPAPQERTALPRPQGLVRVDNLIAGPPGAQPVLKGLRFGATPGMLVAIVGASGSGKSTLARALVGAWAPTSGTVRLDEADLRHWDRAELGPWIGYLPQDVELFEGTVAENIARFGPRDDAKVVQAAQRAGVHDMVLRLPRGYETPVGEGGCALSAGQRQRIGLARSVYGEPALLVLDEPNAHLDEAGDAALLATLRALKAERRTVFVVTHRRNLLGIADAVLVLANGAIQAYGPRDAVLQSIRQLQAPPRGAAAQLTQEEVA